MEFFAYEGPGQGDGVGKIRAGTYDGAPFHRSEGTDLCAGADFRPLPDEEGRDESGAGMDPHMVRKPQALRCFPSRGDETRDLAAEGEGDAIEVGYEVQGSREVPGTVASSWRGRGEGIEDLVGSQFG